MQRDINDNMDGLEWGGAEIAFVAEGQTLQLVELVIHLVARDRTGGLLADANRQRTFWTTCGVHFDFALGLR